MADQQTIISARIQNRRGLRQNLPQPLLPGELGLATDTGQVFIGADPLDPASITSPIIEIYNDYITDTISNEAIENSYVAVANQVLGTTPFTEASGYIATSTGSEAEVSLTITEGGPIEDVIVTNSGSGYTSDVSATVADPTGTGAVLEVTRNGTAIESISVISGGSGYSDPVIVISDAAGSGATARADYLIGEVTDVTIESGGTGYQVGDTVEIEHPYGTDFSASVTAVDGSGAVTEITIDSQGRNYQNIKYGYVARIKGEEYSYIDANGDTQTAFAFPDINTDPDVPGATEVMFIPEYERVSDEYDQHEWRFVAYKKPLGTNIPTYTFEYVDDLSVPSGSQTTTIITFEAKTIPYPYTSTPFDNEPFYQFNGKTLDLSVKFPADESYNSADAAAAAQAINWSFNNGLSGFEYINGGEITDLGITGATGRGTGLVTVAQNIEIKTDRGNEYNTELATLVRGLRATRTIANNDEFNRGLISQYPNPLITVEDDILSAVTIDDSGSGYIDPIVLNNGVPLTDPSNGSEIIELSVNRSIADVNVTNKGYGYDLDNPPSVLIEDNPLGTGATFDVTTYDGVIAEVTVESAGIGYTEADYLVFCAASDPLDPVDFDVNVTNGRISNVAVNYGGNGFVNPRVFIYDKPIWNKEDGSKVYGTLAANEKIVPVLEVSNIEFLNGVTSIPGDGTETVTIANADQLNADIPGIGSIVQPSIDPVSNGTEITGFTITGQGANFTLDEELADTKRYRLDTAYDPVNNDKPYVLVNGTEVVELSVKFSVVELLLVRDDTIVSSVGQDFPPFTTNSWIIDTKGEPDNYAQADVEVSNGEIASLTVADLGSGYFVPRVLLTGPGEGAEASPIIRDGVISSVDVTNGGQYYSLETFSVNSQASATATQSGGSIDSITITDQGAGYTRTPTVTITDANGPGSGASASASITNVNGKMVGYITDINITTVGSGYVDPVITISEPDTRIETNVNVSTGEIESVDVLNGGAGFYTGIGSGATATATTDGDAITDITVTAGGSEYYGVPTVTITGDGSGAEAVAEVRGGEVVEVTVIEGGTGYTGTPTVSFTDERVEATVDVDDPGPGTGALAEAVLTGKVTGAIVDSGGANYSNPSVSLDDPEGSGAILQATVYDGSTGIEGIFVTDGGTGYTSAPNVTINDPDGTGATATASISGGQVTDITVDTAGTGYTDPTIVIGDVDAGGGTGATAVATGSIKSIDVTNAPPPAGSGYSQNPTVTISDTTGSGASATAVVVGVIEDITISNGGNNYINPTITIDPNDGILYPGSASPASFGEAYEDATATPVYGLITAGTVVPTNYQLSPGYSLSIVDTYTDLNNPSYSGGTGATMTPFIRDGVITKIEFQNSRDYGLGYISDPDITVTANSGSGAIVGATVDNNAITSVDIVNGGSGYPAGTWKIDTADPNASLPPVFLSFNAPDGLRSTGIWYDIDEADSFTIRYSAKNSSNIRKGELSVTALGGDFVIEDRYSEITNNSDPLSLTFVPEVDSINNIIEIKYSARDLPSESTNPTSLSTNTLRWKNF